MDIILSNGDKGIPYTHVELLLG